MTVERQIRWAEKRQVWKLIGFSAAGHCLLSLRNKNVERVKENKKIREMSSSRGGGGQVIFFSLHPSIHRFFPFGSFFGRCVLIFVGWLWRHTATKLCRPWNDLRDDDEASIPLQRCVRCGALLCCSNRNATCWHQSGVFHFGINQSQPPHRNLTSLPPFYHLPPPSFP